ADYKIPRDQLAQDPDSRYWIVNNAESHCRYITMRAANLLHARFSGIYDYETYEHATLLVLADIDAFWEQFAPEMLGASTEFGTLQFPNGSGTQSFAFTGNYWSMNYIFAEVHAIGLLLHHQRSLSHGYDQDYMSDRSLEICKLVAATN